MIVLANPTDKATLNAQIADGQKVRRTVAQSALIHPDWDAATHLNYVMFEAWDIGADEAHSPVSEATWPTGPRTYRLDEFIEALCRMTPAQMLGR